MDKDMKNLDWEFDALGKRNEAAKLIKAGEIEQAYKILLGLCEAYKKHLKVRNSHNEFSYIDYTDILQSLKEIEKDSSEKEKIYLTQIEALNKVESTIRESVMVSGRNEFLLKLYRSKAKLYNERIEELKLNISSLDKTRFNRIKELYNSLEEESSKITRHIKGKYTPLATELIGLIEVINYKKSLIEFFSRSPFKNLNSENELYQLTRINLYYQSFYESLAEYVNDKKTFTLIPNSANSESLEIIYKEFADLLDDIRDLKAHTLNSDNLKEEAIKVRAELKQYYLNLNNQEEAKKQEEALSRLQGNQVNSFLGGDQISPMYQSESHEDIIDLNEDNDFLDLNEEDKDISSENDNTEMDRSDEQVVPSSTLKRSHADLEKTKNQASASKKIKSDKRQPMESLQEVAENPAAKFVEEQLQKKPLKSILVTKTETAVNFDGSIKAGYIGDEPDKLLSKSTKKEVSWKGETRLNKYAEPEDFNKFYNHLNLTFAEEMENRNRNIKITETPSGDLLVSRDTAGMKEWEKQLESDPIKYRNVELRDGISKPLSNFPTLKLNKGPKKDNPALARYKEATKKALETLNTDYQKEDFSNINWVHIIKNKRTENNISEPNILQKPLTKNFHELISEQRRVFNTKQNSKLKVYKATPMSAMAENGFLFNGTLREKIIEDSKRKHEELFKNKYNNKKINFNKNCDNELTSLSEYTSTALTNLHNGFEAAKKALNEKLINDYHNKFDGANYTTLGNDISSIFNGTHSLSRDEVNKVISKMTVIDGLLAKELNPMIEAHETEVKALKLREEEAKKTIKTKLEKGLHDLEIDHQKELKKMEDRNKRWQDDAEKKIREICGISERDWSEHLTSPRPHSGNDRSM
jgi:hypothetical protein